MNESDLLQEDEGTFFRLGLASAEEIRRLAAAEVTAAETVRSGTGRPILNGLFCERIFGREQDWECACGRVRGVEYLGMECNASMECAVESA